MQRLKYESLLKVEGMTRELADLLTQNEIESAEDLAQAQVEELTEIGIEEEKAKALIAAAKRFMNTGKEKTTAEGSEEKE